MVYITQWQLIYDIYTRTFVIIIVMITDWLHLRVKLY